MNTVAGSGDTGPRSVPPKTQGLRARVLSTLVLAPPAAAAVYYGFPWFDLAVAASACLLGREWATLTGTPLRQAFTYLVAGTVIAAIVAVAAGSPQLAPAIAVAGAVVAAMVAGIARPTNAAWAAAGVLAVALPCIAIIWLRADPVTGRATVLWLVCAVWATDIGAYAAGRIIGGPKLAPKISPGKTWAGLAGGVASSALVGAAAAWVYAPDRVGLLVEFGILSAALAVVAQAGDLAESRLKRHLGAKDSGDIIPGHGGAWDRLDGLLAAALAIASLHLVTGGSPFAWL